MFLNKQTKPHRLKEELAPDNYVILKLTLTGLHEGVD